MTGTIHSRELLSLSTHIFFITRIVYLAQHQDADVLDLLKRTNLYFVPMVNVDSLNAISKSFLKDRTIPQFRKNRHSSPQQICSPPDSPGVDLNRNFGFGFAGPGSSSNPCDEEYRGAAAFSEPETLALKKFVESHQNIKFSIDYHAYGNDYVLPSMINRQNMKGTAYEEFLNEAELDSSHKFGSCEELLSYTTSGDISDWMLGEKNIPALSVEIGADPTFTPAVTTGLKDIGAHVKPFYYVWNKIVQQIDVEVVKSYKRYCDQTAGGLLECSDEEGREIIYLVLNITNKGFSPSDSDAAGFYLIAPGDKIQVIRLLKDMREVNSTNAIKLISNGYSITLPSMKARGHNEILVVLSKVRDSNNKPYIINLKYNEFPHLSQKEQKNVDIDTAAIKVDTLFSVELYAGRKGLQYYIWMALGTVLFIAVLAVVVFYVAKIWKKRENVPVDLPLPEFVHDEGTTSGIELREIKDGL